MAVPECYSNPHEYFCRTITFLNKYHWIFDTSNTQYLKDKILEYISPDWIEPFNSISSTDLLDEFLSSSDSFEQHDNWPCTLKCFVTEMKGLKPSFERLCVDNFKYAPIRGCSPKKLHEIDKLAACIRTVCSGSDVIIVDLGAGLGYLSQYLHEKYSFKVLGLEGQPGRVLSAKRRQEKHFSSSCESVKYRQHFIVPESGEFIREAIEQEFNDSKTYEIVLVGLHACADLHITAIKLFLSMKEVIRLVIMPCCYHKVSFKEGTHETLFGNIPLSKTLKNAFESTDIKPQSIINRPFLRLACQQTAAQWKIMSSEDRRLQSQKMFERGVAEALREKNEIIIANKRSGFQTKTDPLDFAKLQANMQLVEKETFDKRHWSDSQRIAFNEMLDKYSRGQQMTQILLTLQTSIQDICENIVLLDKICFINEMNDVDGSAHQSPIVQVKVKRLTDEKLSARSFAIVAAKTCKNAGIFVQ